MSMSAAESERIRMRHERALALLLILERHTLNDRTLNETNGLTLEEIIEESGLSRREVLRRLGHLTRMALVAEISESRYRAS